ncbi:MAG: hypothetical protein M3Q95_05285 [Bacteroidota bacterium]|nr:hypothetical protein [Bacteroidota bacterium]
MKTKPNQKDSEKKEDLPGYPMYPESEDLFENQDLELLDEAAISGQKLSNSDLTLGKDLDVPGSDLDDAGEIIGKEDEENNYYSLGGDNHNDLEEN